MQTIHASMQHQLPKFFIPIQIVGAALTGLGLLALCSGLGRLVANEMPTLADNFSDWALAGLGAFVLIGNGLRLVNRAKKFHVKDLAPPVNNGEFGSYSEPVSDSVASKSVTLMPSKKTRIISTIFGSISALLFMGLGCAMAVSYFSNADREMGVLVVAAIFIFAGLLFGLIARSWMNARVELDADGFISFHGVFVKRRYALSEIKSVKRNSNRGAHFVVVRTASSYFTVTDYSFSSAQLSLVEKFCDPQGKLTSVGF